MKSLQKIIVNAPEHKLYHGKEMFVQWITEYTSSKKENCKWYHVTLKEEWIPPMFADLYLGEKQIIQL